MAFIANSIAAPAGAPPSLWRLRGLFLFADAAREVVVADESDRRIAAICDDLISRLISSPIRSRSDVRAKLWLLELASQREWDHRYCARPVIGELDAFLEQRLA